MLSVDKCTNVQDSSILLQHPANKASIIVIYQPLDNLHTSISFLFEVFHLAFPQNSKLNPTNTTKCSTTTTTVYYTNYNYTLGLFFRFF